MNTVTFQIVTITFLSLTLLCVLFILVFLLLTWFRPDALSRRKKAPPTELTEEASGRDAAHDAVAEGIARYAKEFDGLYEGLYQSGKNRTQLCTDAYEEWCDRAGQSEDTCFRAAFETLFSREDVEDETRFRAGIETLLACIAQAGITRDRDTGLAVTADKQLADAYISADGARPLAGSPYTIIKPAWLSGGKVVEFGLLMAGTVGLGTETGEN